MMNNLQIGVVGLSHLGVVASAGLSSLGFRVLGVDPDESAVRLLEGGETPYPEPSLPELMQRHRELLAFTTDFSKLSQCDIVVFGEDTIITAENEMDLSRVRELLDLTIPYVKPEVSILFMSQVPVGTTRSLRQTILDRRGSDFPFRLHYWVDVLVVGDAVARFLDPGRIIVGHEREPWGLSHEVEELFHAFHCPVFPMNYESAEITKSAVNVFLATTVTFANTLSDLCEAVGADYTQIIPALRSDRRIGPHSYIKQGLGLSGGHLERDLVALSRQTQKHQLPSTLLDLILRESKNRYLWLKQKIESLVVATSASPHIAIWGLSYKKNTDSTHGAPSLKIIRDFAERAELTAYDPAVVLPSDLRVTTVSDRYEALRGADGLLILSDWDEFKDLDIARLKKAMKEPLIIDPLGVLGASAADLAREGVTYVTMGRS